MPYIVEKASDRMAVGRLTGGTRFNSVGVLEVIPAGQLRIDFDRGTLECLGVLNEEAATNILLDSSLLATQARTVTAVEHALSFYGTGSIALSGAHVAEVVGISSTARQSLVFTPAAGTLTLTVTGQVTLGQLEIGSAPTSPIPTTTVPVTRAADDLSFDLPVGSYDLTYTFDNDATLVLPAQSGTHVIAGALARRWIKAISARLSP